MKVVKQMALCVSIVTLQSNNGVCERKITMQKDNVRWKKIVNTSKWAAFAHNNNQQMRHFTVPDSVIGFNVP
jgi:hypothetical protein